MRCWSDAKGAADQDSNLLVLRKFCRWWFCPLIQGFMTSEIQLQAFSVELATTVPASGNIPDSVSGKYVKVLTMCHIGNGYGVSSGAEPIYNNLINRWQDHQISQFIVLPAKTVTRNLPVD